ncbi:putative glycolipid-binding domain-containing protein [Dongia deserti]|uniref:putative glycolipid-binding domain-containing protein n=1 Tax=Dongia deserti TaxID=2268030 RepID=UPI000E654E8E|nr:putative glycolipid-binding domain-containing protein [Dongia deserti]
MTNPAQKTLRRVVWRRILDDQSFEECETATSLGRFAIGGRIIAAQEGEPLSAWYEIHCDQHWSAQAIDIEQAFNDTSRHLLLERAGEGWLVNGVRDAQLDGCMEPDLGLTPSTNALAIRRLDLAIWQSAEILCAWVKFPALSVEPSLQRYERLADREYRYTNVASGFTAIVTVDELALPVSYERIWLRIADWHGDES